MFDDIVGSLCLSRCVCALLLQSSTYQASSRLAKASADAPHETPPIIPARSIRFVRRSAIRFTTFERVSGWLQEDQGKVKAVNALAAGTVAGAVESATCLTPLQNIQIKMMQMNRYDGTLGSTHRRVC